MRLKVVLARATTAGGIARAGYVRAADMYASYEVGPSWFATSPGVSPASPPAFETKGRVEPDDFPVIKTRARASAPASTKNDAVSRLVRVLVITTSPQRVRRSVPSFPSSMSSPSRSLAHRAPGCVARAALPLGPFRACLCENAQA